MNVTQANPITFNTSVRGSLDYRFDVDAALCSGVECTSLWAEKQSPTTDIVAGYNFWWDINTNLDHASNVNSWTDRSVNATILAPVGTGLAYIADTIGFPSVSTLGSAYDLTTSSIAAGYSHHLFFTLLIVDLSKIGDVIKLANSLTDTVLQFTQNGTQLTLNNSITTLDSTKLSSGVWYVVEVVIDPLDDTKITVNFWRAGGGVVETISFDGTGSSGNNIDTIILGHVSSGTNSSVCFNQLMGYDNILDTADKNTVLTYLFGQTTANALFSLPIIFPVCSQPLVN